MEHLQGTFKEIIKMVLNCFCIMGLRTVDMSSIFIITTNA